MKISYNWLKKYISSSVNIKLICNILTDIGFNVEKLKKISFSENNNNFKYFFIFKKTKNYFFIFKKTRYKLIFNILYNFFF